MKAKEEIYKVKFGDIIENGNTTYFLCILGSEGVLYYESVIPESIILKGTNILIEFTNKTKMVIKYSDNVQLFYREIEKTETDGGDIQTESKSRAIRKRSNTK